MNQSLYDRLHSIPQRRSLPAFLLILLAAPLLHAGAWVPGRGETYLKFSANLFKSDANFDIHGDRFEPLAGFEGQFSRFRDENLSLYFETGLGHRLALFGNLTYKEIEQHTRTAALDLRLTNSGFADVDLGLRYQLTEGRNVWSLAFLYKLPYLYDDENFFALGNDQEDFEGRLLYGRSLPRGFYAGLEAGYRLRLEEPSDEYRFLSELGWSHRRVYARTKLDVIRAVDSLDALAGSAINPILSPIFDLTTLELTLGVHLSPRWHLETSYTDTVQGRNTADGKNTQWSVVLTF